LKVTRLSKREASAVKCASIARSSPGWRKKYCRKIKRPSSNQPKPIRKAKVPVPPASPVVSVSRKSVPAVLKPSQLRVLSSRVKAPAGQCSGRSALAGG